MKSLDYVNFDCKNSLYLFFNVDEYIEENIGKNTWFLLLKRRTKK